MMVICGIKLTHDGSICLIKDGKLFFNIEMEKISNRPRYSQIEELSTIKEILNDNDISLNEIDYFAIDGWGGDDQNELAIQPRLEIGEKYNKIRSYVNGETYGVKVNQYEEKTLKTNVLEGMDFYDLKIDGNDYEYMSYLHVAGHIMSAYCTSSFAKKGESSYILVWDGGMYPRLYYFDAKTNKVENFGPLFLFIGNIYTIFSQHFGPFKVKGSFAKDSLSVAGKVMAYIALGEVKEELFDVFEEIYSKCYKTPMGFANVLANEFKKRIEGQNYKDEDILATFHVYLQNMLINKLVKKVKRFNRDCKNLCISGGCGLNIKWNSAIRNEKIFNDIYVSPFPNDSGSAIGTACCCMLQKTGNKYLDWSVYSGPDVIVNEPVDGWETKKCSIKELASLLYESSQPVVFLNGKAELGPRALGNRSILAAPTSIYMKETLNMVKKRENYRPISPICLEEKAHIYFNPGIPDPFMLFDHEVKEECKDKIPAICHLDGTARLQTVTREQNPLVTELIEEYEKLSSIPMLCNTSANYNGHGFFPDVMSVTEWGRVNYVWCDGILYEKKEKVQLNQNSLKEGD